MLANNLFKTLDEGFATIQHIGNGSKGTVRIGTECHSFYQGLPTFIQKMAMLYPDIEVDIVLDATHQPIPKLLSKEIDMSIVTTRPVSKELKSMELYEDEVMCVMNTEHHLAKQDYLNAGDFSDLHLIIHSFPMESVSVYEHFLRPAGVTPKKISAIPFTSVSLEMIKVNMGVMCVPKWNLDSFNLSDQITFKQIGKNGLKRTQYLVFREEDESKQYISDFIRNFREEFEGL